MRTQLLLLVAVLLSALSVCAFAQDRVSPPAPGRDPAFRPAPTYSLPSAAAAVDKSVGQLLDEVEQLRAKKADLDKQKAELEKKEQELLTEARKKLQKETERINRLGGNLPDQLSLPFIW
jgi:hypothetical protein